MKFREIGEGFLEVVSFFLSILSVSFRGNGSFRGMGASFAWEQEWELAHHPELEKREGSNGTCGEGKKQEVGSWK